MIKKKPKPRTPTAITDGFAYFIDSCLAPTTLRKEVMQPSAIYTYYLQFTEHYKIPQGAMQGLGVALRKQFHVTRNKDGSLYFCKVKDDLIS